MDVLRTVYAFDPTLSKILLIGLVIGIWGTIVDRNKRIFLCVIFSEAMFVTLVYLGVKYEYAGIIAFFLLIMVVTIGIYVIQRIQSKRNYDHVMNEKWIDQK